MRHLGVILVALCLVPVPLWAATDVYIETSRAGGKRMAIAVADFSVEGPSTLADQARQAMLILKDDLRFSGLFQLVENEAFVRDVQLLDEKQGVIAFKEWITLGADALVKGRYRPNAGGVSGVSFEGRLYDVQRGSELGGVRYQGGESALRTMMHRFADEIVWRFSGERGIAMSKIAFVARAAGHKEIYSMDYDGYNPQRLTAERSSALTPAWSANGRSLLFTTYRSGNPDLYQIDQDGVNRRPFSTFRGLNIAPAWSPQGDRVAFVLSRDGNPEIYTANREGKDLRRLTSYPAIDTSPAWSPSGREIIFTSDRSGSPQLYIMDAEGGNVRRLTYEGSYNDGAAWSPRGDLIAFTAKRKGVFQIVVTDPNGREVRQLTLDSGSNEAPSWSANGRHLAFQSTRDGESQIYVMDGDGSNQRRLTRFPGGATSPAWSPRLDSS